MRPGKERRIDAGSLPAVDRVDPLHPLAAVASRLLCPACGGPLRVEGARAVCDRGHSIDIARQGYLNLAPQHHPGTGDTAAMLDARAEVMAAGVFAPVADAVVEAARRYRPSGNELALDLATGTGYYLARLLDGIPDLLGVGVDLSVPALRRAARAHPRAAAVGADVWQQIPVAAQSVGVLTSVFGPRNRAEIHRVLSPGGVAIVVTPAANHLGELVDALGLVGVHPDKDSQLIEALTGFELLDTTALGYQVDLSPAHAAALVAMGPSARHLDLEGVRATLACRTAPITATVAVQVRPFCPSDSL